MSGRTSDKTGNSIAFVALIVSIIGVFLTVIALRYSHIAYESEIENYKLQPIYELDENGLRIINNHPELFEIKEIYVTGYDQLRIEKNHLFNLATLNYARFDFDEPKPNLNNVYIDFSIPNQHGGEIYDVKNFKEWYWLKRAELDETYSVMLNRRILEVNISYENKRTYRNMAEQVDLYITDDYKIRSIWEGESNSFRHPTFNLVGDYEPECAEEDWQFFMDEVSAVINAENYEE